MAKVKNPFFSLRAHGTIAKAMTARRLHSGAVMSAISIPTDRKTTNQVGQRNFFREAVASWKTHISGAILKEGYKLAGTLMNNRFNRFHFFIREFLNALRLNKTVGSVTDVYFEYPLAGRIGAYFYFPFNTTAKFYYGSDPTLLDFSAVAYWSDVFGRYSNNCLFPPELKVMYFQIRSTDPANYMVSGVYKAEYP